MPISSATLKLLRFPFSYFLMPVFMFAWYFALTDASYQQPEAHLRALLIWIIWHLIIYPASNGYNSYHDNDTGSIGGLKHPPKASKQLLYAANILDIIGAVLAFFINTTFAIGLILCVAVSRAYSYRGIRLKKFPFVGYASVVIFQGGIIFFITVCGIRDITVFEAVQQHIHIPALISACMIGGVYPLTQIYQHEQDAADGVTTISQTVGYLGTFLLSGAMFAGVTIGMFCIVSFTEFLVFQICLLPVIGYFTFWMLRVQADVLQANFEHTMVMNVLAATAMNFLFALLLINQLFILF